MNKSLHIFLQYALFLLLIAISVILAFGKGFQQTVLDGISLWFLCVLPALFPFSVITAILSALSITGKIANKFSPLTSRAFKVNGAVSYAFFMSVLSGYPVGAKLVSDLKEKNLISPVESVRASVLCSTSSPTFLIVSVGSIMFSSVKFGVCLFICHILSAFITGFTFSFYKKEIKPTKFSPLITKKVDNLFYESVFSSVLSVLTVGGIITVFYLFTEILLSYHILEPVISLFSLPFGKANGKAFTLGLFECTKGLKTLSTYKFSILTLPIACFCTSFGGLSVIMQSVAFLKKAKIKIAPFVFSKLFSAILSLLLGFIFFAIFY